MFKFEGVFRNGVVVPNEPLALKDGTRIKFEDVADETAEDIDVPTFAEAFGDLCGAFPDLPPDLAAQHDHYRLGTPKR